MKKIILSQNKITEILIEDLTNFILGNHIIHIFNKSQKGVIIRFADMYYAYDSTNTFFHQDKILSTLLETLNKVGWECYLDD